MPSIDFEILVDKTLASVTNSSSLKRALNKSLLSLVNDFQDRKWRKDKFQNFIWDNIAETALSAQERESLVDKSHSTLTAAAKNLRLSDNDVTGEGSEIAEIFLYGVMKNHFGASPGRSENILQTERQ
ncbi:Hachiman antiphage defense system protein HamA [Methylobacterium sp. P31]